MNIKKQNIFNTSKNLDAESYITEILKEAYSKDLLDNSDIENIQLQYINLLAYKSERYNRGDSSSIKVDVAQNIMKSNIYTIGLYLKSLNDDDSIVNVLKSELISDMYQKGRNLIDDKIHISKNIYDMIQDNKISTINYTYNATINEDGIGIFFELYNPEYEAHETPGNIDYQLCNPDNELIGIEYIQKYLEDIYLENEFCRNFATEDIHHLLSGYDENYIDLLINIYEHILTNAIGCNLTNNTVLRLNASEKEIIHLQNELLKDDENLITKKIRIASKNIIKELDIKSPLLISYIDKSLSSITSNILHAVKINTLNKTIVSQAYPELKPKIDFFTGVKMEDEDYRKLINDLIICRYSSDKLLLIKENVKSFADLEDILFDAQLNNEEITSIFAILKDIEIAALIKKYPYDSEINAIDISEEEQSMSLVLKNYFNQLSVDRQNEINKILNQLSIN